MEKRKDKLDKQVMELAKKIEIEERSLKAANFQVKDFQASLSQMSKARIELLKLEVTYAVQSRRTLHL